MSQPPLSRRSLTGLVLLILVLIGADFAWLFYLDQKEDISQRSLSEHRQKSVEVFKPFLPKYSQPVGEESPEESSVTDSRKAICVTWNKSTNSPTIDDSYFRLPKERRAATPDQVDLVVQLIYSADIVGKYAKKGSPGEWGLIAERGHVKGRMIDLSTNRVVSTRDFLGEMPPSELRSGPPPAAKYPSAELINEWLFKYLGVKDPLPGPPSPERGAAYFATFGSLWILVILLIVFLKKLNRHFKPLF